MKNCLLIVALIFASAATPCRAVVHPINTDRETKSRPINTGFQQKRASSLMQIKTACQKLAKNHFLKPKKQHKSGIRWDREPKDGLKSVLLGLLGWTLISLSFPVVGAAFLAFWLAFFLLGIAFGIGMRGLHKKRPSDRVLCFMGIGLGAVSLLWLVFMSLYAAFSIVGLVVAIPLFLLFLVFGF